MRRSFNRGTLFPAAVFLGGFLLYWTTLAPSIVFGDPAEYTLVPHVWGIVHPPGYAFMTLLVRGWQTLVPIGSVAYRTNLLSAAAAAGIGMLVWGVVRTLRPNPVYPISTSLSALFAAAVLLAAPDFWQHAIHTNAHIVTAAVATASLFALLRWRGANDDRWLYGFAVVTGLGVTQHPLTVFGFPAYAAFILTVRPGILRDPRSLLKLSAAGVVGLLPWLYFPIRASIAPPPVFGPADMNTLDGFLNLVLARGLRVNLFAYGLGDQWHRLIVFWGLLRLQFALPVIGLAALGLGWLWRRDWRAGMLFTLHLLVNVGFTINTVQDVMAYLLIPFVVVAVLAGVGAMVLVQQVSRVAAGRRPWSTPFAIRSLLFALLFSVPALATIRNYAHISLRRHRAADDFVEAVFNHFEGQGNGAVLLSDWEHMTPLWYHRLVTGRALDPADVRPVYVVGSSPTLWVDRIWENIEVGPVYLLEYRRDVIEAGFRLRAEGIFYRVAPPPAMDAPDIAQPLWERAGPIEWLGYEVQLAGPVAPGARVPVLLAFRTPEPVADIVHPYARLGPFEQRWTTDSHWLTPWWEPGEIIVERWEIAVPLDAPAGEYPLSIGLSNLSTGEDLLWRDGARLREIATVEVVGEPQATLPDALLANFGQRVGLTAARASSGNWRMDAPWTKAQPVRPGDAIEIRLDWLALATPEDSLTVFVHLIDANNGLWASRDYTPLGGSFPTQLWFPKWLPGQRVTDPYRLIVPETAPPGLYLLEVGLYGLRSIVRVQNYDASGNIAGDRFVLGAVEVVGD
ncbi:MAG: protein O-mannosyl-transferase family [Anaerolineales bacterium]